MSDDPYAQNSVTQDIAKGHVEVVLLLLGAVVEYLTRGRGDARLLAQEMRASPKGERLGQWMLEHEDALKKRPDLQRPEPSRSPFDNQDVSDNPVVARSETKNITDLNAQASQSVGKVTAPIDFDGHVRSAEIKPNGNVIGGHSIATGDVQIISGTASAPNAQGVYSARVKVADPQNPGSFLPKTNNGGISTLFPDSWTADRIKVEVDGAFQNRIIVGNKWTGTTPSGVRVEGYLNPKLRSIQNYRCVK